MFLHKFDILNRYLNGLFQKLLPVVTKLCAVTKLGDLTVCIYANTNEINLKKTLAKIKQNFFSKRSVLWVTSTI